MLDILSASGGKGINNPILVITAGGRVDVDLALLAILRERVGADSGLIV